MGSCGLRVTALAVVLSGLALLAGFAVAGGTGLIAGGAFVLGCALAVFLYSERTVLTALRARPVSEVEFPDLYWLVRDLATAARLPVPRLYVAPAPQPNVLALGRTARSVALCCTDGLLRSLSTDELRAGCVRPVFPRRRGRAPQDESCQRPQPCQREQRGEPGRPRARHDVPPGHVPELVR